MLASWLVSRDLVALGKRIAAARVALGLSQRAFAAEIGVHHVTVADWERGKAEPNLAHLQKVAARTSRPLDWFIGEAA